MSLYQGVRTSNKVFSHATDDVPINSPGGLASLNMYTPEYESSDIFGGSNPRYVYGEYGNVYGRGESEGTMEYASTPLTYNNGNGQLQTASYWENDMSRPAHDITGQPGGHVPGYVGNPTLSMGQNPKVSPDEIQDARVKARKEPFEWVNDGVKEKFEVDTKDDGLSIHLNKPLLDIAAIVIFYVALSFFQRAVGEAYIEYAGSGEPPSWKSYMLTSLIITIVGLLLIMIANKTKRM